MKYINTYFLMILALIGITACSSSSENTPDPTPPAIDNPQVSTPTSQVIYEANPLFFASNNCLDAIKARLDEIKSMGTDVLWIMPIYEQGQKNAIGSPYCVKDFYAVNPQYGDMQSLKSLVDAAHAKGMTVILDWIANHTAWDNAWVTEHPDWYTENRTPDEQGWKDVAILNYDNRQVWQAMTDAMLYWVNEAGIDGFRCDYSEGVPRDFWKQAIEAIRKAKKDAFMLAEASDFNLYTVGFDMIYDWSWCTDLQDFYNGRITFDKLVENADKRAKQIPEGKNIMRYVVNHDVASEKSAAKMYGSGKAMPGAYVITAFVGQVPLIYSGMEAGFDNTLPFIGAKPLTWDASLLSKYDAIGRAYDATEKARAGILRTYSSGSKCVVFSHSNGDKEVLVILNPTASDLQAKVPIAYAGENMTDALTGSAAKMASVVNVPAYGYQIYTR